MIPSLPFKLLGRRSDANRGRHFCKERERERRAFGSIILHEERSYWTSLIRFSLLMKFWYGDKKYANCPHVYKYHYYRFKFQISNLNLSTSCQLTSTMSLRSATYASSVCSSSSNTHLSGKQPYMVMAEVPFPDQVSVAWEWDYENIFSLSLFVESFFLVFFVLDLRQFSVMSLQVISALFKVVHCLLRALLNLIGQVSQNIAV